MARRRRGTSIDWVAWGLLLVGLTVAVAVFSFEPAAVLPRFPAEPPSTNLLGVLGDWIADELFRCLGAAVYLFLASWFVLVLALFMRQGWGTWSRRFVGWVLLIPCAAIVADIFASGIGPLAGGGGILGAALCSWLQDTFVPLGQIALFTASLLAGLLLAADFVAMRIFRGAWWACRWGVSRIAHFRRAGDVSPLIEAPSAPIRGLTPPARPLAPPARSAKTTPDIPINRTGITLAAELVNPDKAAGDHEEPVILSLGRAPTAAEEEQRFADYELPPLSLLDDAQPFPYQEHDQALRDTAALLEKTFRDFDLQVRVVGINTGPVITQYEIALQSGLRLNKVTVLADDLALNLKVPSVRVVAPIPGKNTVGIEVPNEHRAVVRLKEVILTGGKKTAKAKLPLFLGKDTEGHALVYDLAEMPHLLIAGRTGTGKSVCMNAIILSLLMTRRPDECKMIMIDPKMLELSEYGKIPHLMHPVVKDMKKAEAILAWAVDKMEERYDLLSRARVRSIAGYNELTLEEIHRRVQPDPEEAKRIPSRMPYIVIFVDEMNDLMMMLKREVEGHIIRLAQKSRAAGIHLVVATQKPTVDVITGLIKSNLPARICFQVSSRTDSRVVLDEMGAEKLLGKGDMLFLQPGTSTILRAQGTYSSDEEITRAVNYLECDPCYVQELVELKTASEGGGAGMDKLKARDDLYEQAIEIVVREGRGSVSLLQRAMGIGYGRAARLIDFMAEDGIVGPYNGSNAREVLYTPEQWSQARQAARA